MKKISLASSVVGAALLGVASVGAHAAQNPFAVQELSSGYSVAAAEKAKEGSCGEAKCGADKGKREASKAGHEGSCGADRSLVSKSKLGRFNLIPNRVTNSINCFSWKSYLYGGTN